MTMTLLETVQEYCDRAGLERPDIVMSSTDDTVRQLRALANEVINDIVSRGHSWTKLQKEATFTSVATASQGLISTIAPYGFKELIPNSLYDRTTRTQLFGPRSAPEWQESEALPVTGPFYSYRVWQGEFMMQPTPPAGHTIAFEYASDYAIRGVTSSTNSTQIWKRRYSDDADVFQLDEEILIAGLKAKWRRTKGLSYAQEAQDFEYLLAQAIGTGPDKGTINLTGGTPRSRPGVIIPSGNWNL
jgi:hypothetical protein